METSEASISLWSKTRTFEPYSWKQGEYIHPIPQADGYSNGSWKIQPQVPAPPHM